MHQKSTIRHNATISFNAPEIAPNELEEEVSALAILLQAKLTKILRRYNKDLKPYLVHAEYPTSGGVAFVASAPAASPTSLFTASEISDFLNKGVMLPLPKVVALAAVMNRSLVITFEGNRGVQIPLKYGTGEEDLITQLRFNVYALFPILDHGFDKQKPAYQPVQCEKVSCSKAAPRCDYDSIQSLVLAARYHGYRVNLSLRRHNG